VLVSRSGSIILGKGTGLVPVLGKMDGGSQRGGAGKKKRKKKYAESFRGGGGSPGNFSAGLFVRNHRRRRGEKEAERESKEKWIRGQKEGDQKRGSLRERKGFKPVGKGGKEGGGGEGHFLKL